jgi:hypothetical protein
MKGRSADGMKDQALRPSIASLPPVRWTFAFPPLSQELLYYVPPRLRIPLPRDPSALGSPPPPDGVRQHRRPGSLNITAPCDNRGGFTVTLPASRTSRSSGRPVARAARIAPVRRHPSRHPLNSAASIRGAEIFSRSRCGLQVVFVVFVVPACRPSRGRFHRGVSRFPLKTTPTDEPCSAAFPSAGRQTGPSRSPQKKDHEDQDYIQS